MIPNPVWSASSCGPGPHRLLLALWDFSGWRPDTGDADAFVFPAIDTIAAKLGVGRRAVFAGLAKLQAAGWIQRAHQEIRTRLGSASRYGWRLVTAPVLVRDVPVSGWGEHDGAIEADADTQLALFAFEPRVAHEAPGGVEVDTGGCRGRHPGGVEVDTRGVSRSTPPTTIGTTIEPPPNPREGGGEAARIWAAYEAARCDALGGAPRARLPRSLQALAEELGGGSEAWALVERYALGSVRLAAEARRAGHRSAGMLAACRCDGREWERARFDAVMARLAAEDPPAPRPPPPVVDGRQVDRFERDAWDRGGASAVRELRSSLMAPEQIAERATEWLQRRLAGLDEGGTT